MSRVLTSGPVLGQTRRVLRGAPNVLNLPFDVDAPEGRTSCADFVRVRRQAHESEVVARVPKNGSSSTSVPGRQDFSAICAVGTHGLLKQLSKPNLRLYACELAKP